MCQENTWQVVEPNNRFLSAKSVFPVVNARIYMFRMVSFGRVAKQIVSTVKKFVDNDDRINSAAFAFWMYRDCLCHEFGMTIMRPFLNLRMTCSKRIPLNSDVVFWDGSSCKLVINDICINPGTIELFYRELIREIVNKI